MSKKGATEGLVDVAAKAMGGALFIGTAVLVLAIGFLCSRVGVPTKPDEFGQFGDFVGGVVNPVVGVLTLFALTLTVVMQARQLSLSREELVATQAELARTAAAQEASARLMGEQLAAAKDAATAQHWAADAQARSAEALASHARQAGNASHIAAINSALAAVTQHVEHFDAHVANNAGLAFRTPADVAKARDRQTRLRAKLEIFTDHLLGEESFEFDNEPEASKG